MGLIFGLFSIAILLFPAQPKHVVLMDCPASTPKEEVCVFSDEKSIIAINPTEYPVKVVIQIQRIENVELIYRYPFVEVLPPRSSKTLINYKIVLTQRPYALDYDWGWVDLSPKI
ncbi:MAG: hypothetical protein K2P81_17100 [Bacteriovoracaceae bacterium]|nr:hypothetical protein [Bacteriovoracaceae bacterium]